VTGSAATTTSERPAREPIVGGPIASRPIAPPPAAVRRAEHRTAPLGSDYDYAAAPAAPPFKKRGTSTRKDRDKPVARARPLYIDDADEVDRPRRRGWVGALIAVLLLGTVGTGAVLSWSRIAPMLGLADADPVARIIDAGDTHFARADEPGYREAVRQYTRATAVGENDVRAQTALTRAHGALAQLFSFQADDLEARAAADPTLAGDVAAARREQRSNAEDAARFGRLAVSLDANHVPALLAQADALRLTGDLEAAASSLGRATSLEPEPSAEQHYIAALMALSQRRDPAAARERAEAAVEAASGDLRARLLLARALLASADISGARRQIDAVLDLHEEHAGARALATAIEEGLPPAAPLVATLDGGVDAGSLDAGPAELPAEPAPTAAATSGGRAGSDSVDTSGCSDADCLVRRGADAQMRGDVGRARRYFEQALRLNPNELEANAGLGAIQLETGNVSGALPYLQRAAQANYSDSAILLGQAYRRLGRTEDARAAYQRYLDRNPGGTYAPAAMNALMALGPAPAGTDLPPGTGPSGPSTGDSPSGGGPSGGSPSPDPAGSPPGPGSPNTTPPSTSPNELPAPHGPDPANLPPASDPPSTDP
jgi:tetratricopeptide (TPR) repeat protein